jgi:RimJ/RimL family protein N-acetyltransferase
MSELESSRLVLSPFSIADFNRFVEHMLTDPRVVQFYYSYKDLDDLNRIREQARKDFWGQFEETRANSDLEIWAAYLAEDRDQFVGWGGLLSTSLTDRYGGPELQYMIAGEAHGLGFATELAVRVLQHAKDEIGLESVIATVDIPNTGSIRVLEKLGFEFSGQIESYGSDQMYLYRKSLGRN